ncbi:hypothetical protein [Phytohabitans aurantiacus]|jgi:hypothetical protein|uniref:Uncharacterized protein n=1 Tax=Phytohabitans aurantiacus TaxID=3016789 RepID=A0ABQ5QW42_9ACTN|nr:hypothetical protein [Phytohabitans aurantiacus]GLH98112.1 hypothetical protein Pa4123_33870 [Phytohabitans aurantiacus]
MNRISIPRRVMAVVAAVFLAVAGVAVWATPATAGDPSPDLPDTLSRYCAVFNGEYTETRGSYSCDLDEDAIICSTDDRRCLFFATEMKPGQLQRVCEKAGGRFFDDIVIFTCDGLKALPDYVLTVECSPEALENSKLPCSIYSEPPM